MGLDQKISQYKAPDYSFFYMFKKTVCQLLEKRRSNLTPQKNILTKATKGSYVRKLHIVFAFQNEIF